MGFEPESILIIMFSGLIDIEKKEEIITGYTHCLELGSARIPALGLGEGCICFCSRPEQEPAQVGTEA